MRQRSVSAIIAIILFVPFVIKGGGYFAFCMAVLGIVAIYEFIKMSGLSFMDYGIGLIASFGMLALLIPNYLLPAPLATIHLDYFFYLSTVFLLLLMVIKNQKIAFADITGIIFAMIYIGYGFGFLVQIRELGILTILYQFLVVWSTDIGAYVFGRQFGKRKLAPHISPNKTIEGSLGGIALSTVIGIIYVNLFNPNFVMLTNVWILTIVMSIMGQLGDLVESMIKRHFKVKDSGNFMPGHGGVLDRFDSMIFTSFIFMMWLNIFS
ncbi:phosphatidate cytidylyltransferase [Hutsoniella sourekii]